MKPFDLTRMLAGDKVITKNGRRVVQYHYFEPLKIIVAHVEGENEVLRFTHDGLRITDIEFIPQQDLVMAPNNVEIYQNVYNLYNTNYPRAIHHIEYKTFEEAKMGKTAMSKGILKTVYGEDGWIESVELLK